ncbi:hypothetical protein [Amycolatopsis sp. NPDC054798]
MIQQLATDGKMDLDRRVRDYMPGFWLSAPAVTEAPPPAACSLTQAASAARLG